MFYLSGFVFYIVRCSMCSVFLCSRYFSAFVQCVFIVYKCCLFLCLSVTFMLKSTNPERPTDFETDHGFCSRRGEEHGPSMDFAFSRQIIVLCLCLNSHVIHLYFLVGHHFGVFVQLHTLLLLTYTLYIWYMLFVYLYRVSNILSPNFEIYFVGVYINLHIVITTLYTCSVPYFMIHLWCLSLSPSPGQWYHSSMHFYCLWYHSMIIAWLVHWFFPTHHCRSQSPQHTVYLFTYMLYLYYLFLLYTFWYISTIRSHFVFENVCFAYLCYCNFIQYPSSCLKYVAITFGTAVTHFPLSTVFVALHTFLATFTDLYCLVRFQIYQKFSNGFYVPGDTLRQPALGDCMLMYICCICVSRFGLSFTISHCHSVLFNHYYDVHMLRHYCAACIIYLKHPFMRYSLSPLLGIDCQPIVRFPAITYSTMYSSFPFNHCNGSTYQ